jgi:hypothetical protein
VRGKGVCQNMLQSLFWSGRPKICSAIHKAILSVFIDKVVYQLGGENLWKLS